MHGEFTAVVARSEEGAYVASCAEIPGIVAEAETEEEAIANLSDSIAKNRHTLKSFVIDKFDFPYTFFEF
jgi:hypothetical protein